MKSRIWIRKEFPDIPSEPDRENKNVFKSTAVDALIAAIAYIRRFEDFPVFDFDEIKAES